MDRETRQLHVAQKGEHFQDGAAQSGTDNSEMPWSILEYFQDQTEENSGPHSLTTSLISLQQFPAEGWTEDLQVSFPTLIITC